MIYFIGICSHINVSRSSTKCMLELLEATFKSIQQSGILSKMDYGGQLLTKIENPNFLNVISAKGWVNPLRKMKFL